LILSTDQGYRIGKQTLMKSNTQLWHEGQGEVPQPPPVPVNTSIVASSSQSVPLSFNIEVAFSQLISSMGALQR
jgi:hypothetical protein